MLLFGIISVALAAGLGVLGAPNSIPNPENINTGLTSPVYGTTRYGRPSWAYRSPPSYYRQPVYYPDYPEDIYYRPEPMMHYPYYPAVRQYKNDIYPYYYSDRMHPNNYYGDAAYDSLEDIQDNEDQRGPVRSDALPVGQETWFENDPPPNWQNEDYEEDKEKATFLRNLIMSQRYNMAKNKDIAPEPSRQNYLADYGEYYGDRDTRDFEDEDVSQLKALAGKPLYHVPKTSEHKSKNDKARQYNQWQSETTTQMPYKLKDQYDYDYPSDEPWINWESKRDPFGVILAQNIRRLRKNKAEGQEYTSTTAIPIAKKSAEPPKFPGNGGQKEVVLPRPATPARHPFPESVLKSLATQKKRNPSVYDEIKQLMTLEDEQHKADNNANKGRVQKRFVSSEADLIGELKGLKRRSTS